MSRLNLVLRPENNIGCLKLVLSDSAVSWLISMPRSCRRSSTLRSESGKRTYSITARRMISGRVLKYLNGECFVIRRGYETTLQVSSSFCLTVPVRLCQVLPLWCCVIRCQGDFSSNFPARILLTCSSHRMRSLHRN